MGKIYAGQTAVEFEITVGQDITGATSVLIKYKKPSGATGEFIATIVTPATGVIKYEVTSTAELDEDGTWLIWAYITFASGKVAAGEPFELEIYNEGQN